MSLPCKYEIAYLTGLDFCVFLRQFESVRHGELVWNTFRVCFATAFSIVMEMLAPYTPRQCKMPFYRCAIECVPVFFRVFHAAKL